MLSASQRLCFHFFAKCVRGPFCYSLQNRQFGCQFSLTGKCRQLFLLNKVLLFVHNKQHVKINKKDQILPEVVTTALYTYSSHCDVSYLKLCKQKKRQFVHINP